MQAILELAGPGAAKPCVVELRHLGGALARPPAVPSAVGHRGDAQYTLGLVSRRDGADVSIVHAAHRRLLEALAPWTTGGRCLNFMSGEGTARSAYDPGDHRRLAGLKAIYDHGNTFRLNHYIAPSDR